MQCSDCCFFSVEATNTSVTVAVFQITDHVFNNTGYKIPYVATPKFTKNVCLLSWHFVKTKTWLLYKTQKQQKDQRKKTVEGQIKQDSKAKKKTEIIVKEPCSCNRPVPLQSPGTPKPQKCI